jgi:two-component system, OmpR family, sensor kinase
MSLRARLTILYSMLLGGVLLLFGVLVYVLASTVLLVQVDRILIQTTKDIIKTARVGPQEGTDIVELPGLELTSSVYVQFWRGRVLKMASPSIRSLKEPFDDPDLDAKRPILRNVYFQKTHLRVLTAPLVQGGRPAGVIQAATNLALVDLLRSALLSILATLTLVSMLLAAIASWLGIGKALAPIQTATETAYQITTAGDLSRRIPYGGPAGDEIGLLIRAFNRTLERLENLFTSQQRFLADVSHELRTPLTVIKGNADLIRKIGADDESLDSIKDEADRLTRLVGDLLLLAQAESGKLPLNLRPVELDLLLTDVFQQMGVLAREKSILLRLTDIDQALVNGDRDRLKQVFINLMSNAIEYTPKGGEVFVSLSKSDEMARVVVRDTGTGISAKDLPRIFDRFYRGEKSRTRSKTSGFGLGLSIAYWIVDHHGGRIEIDSHEGQGTTFVVFLPLLEGEHKG